MRRTQILSGVAALLIAGGAVALFDGRGSEGADQVATSGADAGSLDRAAVAGGAAVAGSAGEGTADVSASGPNVGKALGSPVGPRIVKTASLTVSVAESTAVRSATAKVNSIAERLGGYVSSTEAATGEHASSSLTLRVPVSAYDAALQELRALGEVSNETLGGNDVTATLVDLDARLRSLRAQETALDTLMAKARTVGETLQVAQAVAEVRTQIEQLAAQQKALVDQADFATITLLVVGPGVVIDPTPSPDPLLVKALERAAGGALDVLGGVIVVVGYSVPLGVLGALGYGLWRLVSRKKVPATA